MLSELSESGFDIDIVLACGGQEEFERFWEEYCGRISLDIHLDSGTEGYDWALK
jgi:hypothetical protein